ncbi:AhpD-like protein [Ilyonectria destructans]|nr:AhpD-like protein [Ilyonectria destructans]
MPLNTPATRSELQQALYDIGMPIRRQVLSDGYVDNALANGSTEFAKAMQEFTTAFCWGAVWDRPGLERKQRSLINLSMLAATGKIHELAVHTRGAVNNGVSATEIREVFVQVCIYMGVPAGMEAFKASEKVLIDMEKEGAEVKP